MKKQTKLKKCPVCKKVQLKTMFEDTMFTKTECQKCGFGQMKNKDKKSI